MISRLQLKDYLPPMLGFKSPQATNFFPRLSNSSATPIHILQFLAANRVARSASQEEETPSRKGTSAAALPFLLLAPFAGPDVDTRPSPYSTGYAPLPGLRS